MHAELVRWRGERRSRATPDGGAVRPAPAVQSLGDELAAATSEVISRSCPLLVERIETVDREAVGW